jgi:hypothetical protein
MRDPTVEKRPIGDDGIRALQRWCWSLSPLQLRVLNRQFHLSASGRDGTRCRGRSVLRSARARIERADLVQPTGGAHDTDA